MSLVAILWRSQEELIRTLGSMPLSICIIHPQRIPMYQKITSKVVYLTNLGYSRNRIARTLGVSPKVVSQAIQYKKVSNDNEFIGKNIIANKFIVI